MQKGIIMSLVATGVNGEKVTGQERKWEVGVQGPACGLSSLEPWGPGEGLDFT